MFQVTEILPWFVILFSVDIFPLIHACLMTFLNLSQEKLEKPGDVRAVADCGLLSGKR